jgi:hypothetical protein
MGPDGKKPRLLLYAHGLMTVFDEFDRAREVLIQCERDARTVEDCTQVALSWAELFDERDRAVRAMARGERLARRALEWFNLKTVWEHFLSEHDRAEWCRSHYERPGR